MSMEAEQKVTCPKCGKEYTTKIWKSVNTTINPELKEKVLTRELFKTTCPECGNQAILGYDFLYHQMDDKLMIYYVQSQEGFQEAEEAFRGDFLVNGVDPELNPEVTSKYRRRVVRSMNALCEKIQITDAKLDDRVVELMKVLYVAMLQETQPDTKFDDFLFYEKESGGYGFIFIHHGQGIATVDFVQDVYDEQAKVFEDVLANDEEPSIDFAWAVEKFREKENA